LLLLWYLGLDISKILLTDHQIGANTHMNKAKISFKQTTQAKVENKALTIDFAGAFSFLDK